MGLRVGLGLEDLSCVRGCWPKSKERGVLFVTRARALMLWKGCNRCCVCHQHGEGMSLPTQLSRPA